MCPAAPSSAQQRPAAASSAQQWPAATWVKTRVEHLGAPWSTKCPFKTNSPSFYVRLKKMEKKAQSAVSQSESDRNLEAPKEPLGPNNIVKACQNFSGKHCVLSQKRTFII